MRWTLLQVPEVSLLSLVSVHQYQQARLGSSSPLQHREVPFARSRPQRRTALDDRTRRHSFHTRLRPSRVFRNNMSANATMSIAPTTFGIAKGLDPTDEELPALEASADAQAASAATPSTCASEYALMYQAWLSSGTAENLETAQMAIC